MKSIITNAPRLRLLLAISLFAILALGVGAYIFVSEELKKTATDVSKTVSDAKNSEDNLTTLRKLEQELERNALTVERAKELVANSQNYSYQNQIISDLTAYASAAGIQLTNISFTAAVGATPVPAASGSAGAAAPAAPAPVAAGGLKPSLITVTIKSPVNYENLLRFMQSVEQNLTKMQVSRMSVSRSDTGGVSSEVLSIEVYVK